MTAALPEPAGDADASPLGPDAPQHWALLERLEKTTVAAWQDRALAVLRSQPAGVILYGPYWQLPVGRYRLSVVCRAARVRRSNQPVLGVEVIVLSQLELAWRDFTATELHAGAASVVFDVTDAFSLEARSEARFEFKFIHFGLADLTISSIELERVPETTPLSAPAHHWRLLGRLETGWRGRRAHDGGVATPRWAPAGPVLFGGWPYVRLPEGRMRLGLRGQAGSPRRPEQPVVALEVLAPSRWRSRRARASAGDPPESTLRLRAEFGAAELNAGEASFDFTVLDELALDSRVDAPFEFRLLHLGNSALHIDAVDLDRLEGAPAEPSPAQIAAPAIAPRRRKKIVIIGNCQSDILRQGFNWIEGLNRQYEAKYHYVSLLPQNLLDLARRDLEQSDVVLVQDISNWERSPLRDHVPARIEPVTFPGLRIASPWPFDAWNGPADKDAHAREGPNLVFPYQDGLLARLRREIPDQEARFRAYRDLDSPGLVDPKRLHDLEHRRLLAADKKFGFEIGAYILENIRARRIFHTTVRPNRAVLDLLMRHVLKAMGVAGEHHLPEGIEAVLQNPQVPIHPKVAAALGVGWANERTRYLVRGEPITWETYVRRYIAHYG